MSSTSHSTSVRDFARASFDAAYDAERAYRVDHGYDIAAPVTDPIHFLLYEAQVASFAAHLAVTGEACVLCQRRPKMPGTGGICATCKSDLIGWGRP